MESQQISNTEQVFLQNGTVWFISTSSWTAEDKLRPEDIGKKPEDILNIITLGSKKLLPDEIQVKLKKPRSQVSSLMDRLGKHFMHFKGAWWVADKNFLLAKKGLEKIVETQNLIVDDLIANMPSIKAEMLEQYPMLADAEWPSDKHIRRKFGIKITVCQIQGANMKEADLEELAQAKRDFRNQLTSAYEEYKNQILIETQTAIIEACKEISDKIKKGERITESTMKKPRRVVEDYLNVTEVFDIEEVKMKVRELKEKLDGVDAESLRNQWSVAEAFAKTMKTMAGQIGDLAGLSIDGNVKRVVKRKGE